MKRLLVGAVTSAALISTSALADSNLRAPKMSAKRVAHAAGEQSSGLGATETIAVLAGIAVLGIILRSGGGGAGKYTGSNFVHMDCGVVRSWGR